MKDTEFQRTILDAIMEAKARQPTALIHLLYAPELSDPLNVVGDMFRDTALIDFPVKAGWTAKTAPRLVTLNYWSTDADLQGAEGCIGDVLLKRSIRQSYANIYGKEQAQVALTNDDPGMAENAICGWIVSSESARQNAARIARQSNIWNEKNSFQVNRWFYPHCFVRLWPELKLHQKQSLMGNGTWLIPDHFGKLQQCSAVNGIAEEQSQVLKFSVAQHRIIADNLIISALAKAWQSLSRIENQPLPDNAISILHRFVQQGQRHHLDAENLMIYVMTAVQLPNGALEDEEFGKMLADIRKNGLVLRDGLSTLPDSFWHRYNLAMPIPA